MKAVTWRGVNEIGVEDVPEPAMLNDHDVILQVGCLHHVLEVGTRDALGQHQYRGPTVIDANASFRCHCHASSRRDHH